MSRRFLALAAAPLLVLTACGGTEEPKATPEETTEAAAPFTGCGQDESYTGEEAVDTEGTPLDLMKAGQRGAFAHATEDTCFFATLTPEAVTVYQELPDDITTDAAAKTADEGLRYAAIPVTVANDGEHPPVYDGDGSFSVREALKWLGFEKDLDPFNTEIAWNTDSVVLHDGAPVDNDDDLVLRPGEEVDVHLAYPIHRTTDENPIYLRAGSGTNFNWAWELPVRY